MFFFVCIGMTTSNLFGAALRKGYRCVIAIDGFFEWTEVNSAEKGKEKQPYFIHFQQPKTFSGSFDTPDSEGFDRKMLFLAGLFNPITGDDHFYSSTLFSCSIIPKNVVKSKFKCTNLKKNETLQSKKLFWSNSGHKLRVAHEDFLNSFFLDSKQFIDSLMKSH